MKLATYHDGSRDGQLVVVSRDLGLAHYAAGVATRLQQVLDDWNFLSPQLEELSQTLNHGKARHAFAFEPQRCLAPLPRAYRWATPDGEARAAEGATPTMAHHASDELLGPCADLVAPVYGNGVDDGRDGGTGHHIEHHTEHHTEHHIPHDVAHGLEFGAGLAAITGDIARGSTAEAAIDGIRLLLLVNQTRRHLAGSASARARRPVDLASAFGPVAATPDELLHAWRGGRVRLDLETLRNGKPFGRWAAGNESAPHFGELIAALCRHRAVRAGSLVGTGPVATTDAEGNAGAETGIDADSARGVSSIAATRGLEHAEQGTAKTAFLQPGDTLRIDMRGLDGASVFGAIAQKVVAC